MLREYNRPPKDSKILYRYDGELYLTEFVVVKITPCGYWVVDVYDYDIYEYEMQRDDPDIKSLKKWCPKIGKKRLAYPTKKEALWSFICRKKRQIKILGSRLDTAEFHKAKAIKLYKSNEDGDSSCLTLL